MLYKIIFLLFFSVVFAYPSDFSIIYHKEILNLDQSLDLRIANKLKTKKIVFIAGVLNEFAKSYFKDNIETWRMILV